jgi:hypothetical protein
MRIFVRGDGLVEPDADEEEETGEVKRKHFVREEEEVQMIFVDNMHDGTMFGRVEAGAKFGRMD